MPTVERPARARQHRVQLLGPILGEPLHHRLLRLGHGLLGAHWRLHVVDLLTEERKNHSEGFLLWMDQLIFACK